MLGIGSLLGISLVGCGGSGGSKPLSHSQLDAKANAICQNVLTQGKAIPVPSNFQDANQAAAYFDRIEPLVAAGSAKLAQLKPSANDAANWNSFITLRAQGLALLKTIRHKADTKDPSGLQDLAKSPASQAKIQAAARTVGATTCAM
jgi:hypothetical protein